MQFILCWIIVATSHTFCVAFRLLLPLYVLRFSRYLPVCKQPACKWNTPSTSLLSAVFTSVFLPFHCSDVGNVHDSLVSFPISLTASICLSLCLSVCLSLFLTLTGCAAHTQHDLPGGNTRRGQRSFPSEYKRRGSYLLLLLLICTLPLISWLYAHHGHCMK